MGAGVGKVYDGAESSGTAAGTRRTRRYIVKSHPNEVAQTAGIPTSGAEIDRLFGWLKEEIKHTDYGEVGLKFRMHQGMIVGIERTTSIKGKFELRLDKDLDTSLTHERPRPSGDAPVHA